MANIEVIKPWSHAIVIPEQGVASFPGQAQDRPGNEAKLDTAHLSIVAQYCARKGSHKHINVTTEISVSCEDNLRQSMMKLHRKLLYGGHSHCCTVVSSLDHIEC